MTAHHSPSASSTSRHRVLEGTVAVAVLAVALFGAFGSTASAIVKPGDITDAAWNDGFDGDWPPVEDDGSWPPQTTNPPVTPACGIDIGVIIDRSGSIADAGEATNYKNGVNAMIDALAGTPSKIGLWSFATHASDTANVPADDSDGDGNPNEYYPWHQMADLSVPANVTSLKATVSSIPIVTGFSTNWEEGLRAPLQTAPKNVQRNPKPDVYLVITDGFPTVHADDLSSGGSTGNDDMAGGVKSANLLKADGSRVVAVGVGSGVNVDGLKPITGNVAYDGTNLGSADYLTTSFDDLAEDLAALATAVCGSSVTVTKQTSTLAAPTTYSNAPGWSFSGAITDAPPDPNVSNGGVTDASGQVTFDWQSVSAEEITITETQQPGYQLVTRTCTLNGNPVAFTNVGNNAVKLTVAEGANVNCLFQNQPLFIDLRVTKTDNKVITEPGALNDYVIRVTNDSAATTAATGVTLNDLVPANTTFEATGSDPLWSCADESPAGTPCTLAVPGSLDPGEFYETHFVVEVVDPVGADVDQITNTVAVTGGGATEREDPDVERIATDTDTLIADDELFVDKTDDDATAVTGGVIEYDIEYGNTGNQAATNVELHETVPANTTFESTGSEPGWSCADGDPAGTLCTLVVGTVAGHSTDSVTFVVRVDASVPEGTDVIDNTVEIHGDGCEGPCDVDTETTPLEPPEVLPNEETPPAQPPTEVEGEVVLPKTGQDLDRLLTLAGILLILGGAATVTSPLVARRRRP